MLRDPKAVSMTHQYVNEKNFQSMKMNLGHEDKLQCWKEFILQIN